MRDIVHFGINPIYDVTNDAILTCCYEIQHDKHQNSDSSSKNT